MCGLWSGVLKKWTLDSFLNSKRLELVLFYFFYMILIFTYRQVTKCDGNYIHHIIHNLTEPSHYQSFLSNYIHSITEMGMDITRFETKINKNKWV